MRSPAGQRFPRWVRITRSADYQRVIKGGRKCVRRFLVFYALPRQESDTPTRLGLTVSRRIGKAVLRNRLKRRLREIFRRLHADLHSGYDVVVNTRVAAREASYEALEKDFRSCLKELGLFAAPQEPSSPPTESSGEA